MARKLTEEKVIEIEQAYFEKQSVYFVAKKCKVAHQTVCKYRDELKWDERLDRQRDIAAKKSDKIIGEHRARHAKLGQFMQKKGIDSLQTKDIKKIQTRDAKDLIKDGIQIESEALGDTSDEITIKIKLPKGLLPGDF